MPITAQQKRAIARIRLVADGKQRWGTGFLVAGGERLLLTAFHVIGDRARRTPFAAPIVVEFGDPSTGTRVVSAAKLLDEHAYHADDDWALLQCDSVPSDAVPFQLAPLHSGSAVKWLTYGFSRERRDAGKVYEGRVQSIDKLAQLSTGRESAPRDAEGSLLDGLSGSPCLVNGNAVGVILHLPQREDPTGKKTVQDDILFALPVMEIKSDKLALPAVAPLPFLRDVAQCLSRAGELLGNAAELLGISSPDTLEEKDLRLAVADAMLKGGAPRVAQAMRALVSAVPAKEADKVLEFASALSIDAEAASAVQRAFDNKNGRRQVAVCVNASESVTGQRYALRAGYEKAKHPGWLTLLRCLPDAHQEQRRKGIVEEVRDILCAKLACTPDELPEAIEAMASDQIPIIITLPALAPDEVSAVRAELPLVRFLILAGDGDVDALRARYAGVELVEPPILPGREQAVKLAHTKAKTQLKMAYLAVNEENGS